MTKPTKSRGAAGQQYAIIVGLVGVVALFAVAQMGTGVKSLMTGVANRLGATTNGADLGSGGGGGGGGGGGPPACDPSWANVSLLLSMEGVNGGTAFTDTSPSPKSVNAVGNAATITAFSRFGASSLSLDGNGDYLGIADNPALHFNGDFTIEYWIRPADNGGTKIHVAQWNSGASSSPGSAYWLGTSLNYANMLIPRNSDGYWDGGGARTELASATGVLPLNTWSHVAAVRSGTALTIYVNGTSVATGTYSGAFFDTTQTLTIGGLVSFPSTSANGQIDELRITKGVARYTGSFSPPTAAFPTCGP